MLLEKDNEIEKLTKETAYANEAKKQTEKLALHYEKIAKKFFVEEEKGSEGNTPQHDECEKSVNELNNEL